MSFKQCVSSLWLSLMLVGQVLAQSPVGHVTLTLGSAERQELDASAPSEIVSGQAVFEGDRITTGAEAVVHINLIDGALLSVRPNSELIVIRYRYDPDFPSRSEIKFDLVKGIVRSISGQGAQHAKERFRLNTPVAAIGVRGTDFVVSATQDTTKAVVNSGGIVVAPFSGGCQVAGVGPCESGFVELFANDSRAVFVSGRESFVRLIPLKAEFLDDLISPSAEPDLNAAPVTPESDGPSAGFEPQSDVEQQPVSSERPQAVSTPAPQSIKPVAQTTPGSLSKSLEAVAGPAAAFPNVDSFTVQDVADLSVTQPSLEQEQEQEQEPEPEPEPEPVQEPELAIGPLPQVPVAVSGYIGEVGLAQRAMTWGRYASKLDGSDQITQLYREARAERKVLLVDSGYGLYRESSEFDNKTLNSSITFELEGIDASVSREGLTSELSATKAELTVDFKNSAFNTRLDLVDTGEREYLFEAEGMVSRNGVLLNQSSDLTLRGGVDGSGAEAAYLFRQRLAPDLSIEGRTLWGRTE